MSHRNGRNNPVFKLIVPTASKIAVAVERDDPSIGPVGIHIVANTDGMFENAVVPSHNVLAESGYTKGYTLYG